MRDLYNFIVHHPLSKGRVLNNLARAAWYQLRSRLSSAPVVFPYVNGTRMHAARGLTAATGNLYVGLHEFEDMAFVGHALRPGDLFADVGANIGSYSILAGAVGARVVAFEPVEESRNWLHRNVTINSLEKLVTIRKEAVGEAPGSVEFVTDLGASNRAAQPGEKRNGTVVVPVTTLDLAFAEDVPVVMKIDVEGYETLVARGGTKTLSDPRLLAIVLELNGSGIPLGFDDASLHATFESFGFQPFAYVPHERALQQRAPLKFKNSDNVLFVRDHAAMNDRLASAPKLRVHGVAI